MAEAQRRQEAEDKKAEARKQELLGLRSSAQSGGRSSAEDYLRSQGVDVSRHGGDIESKINSILSGIAPDDPNPGSYFKDVGSSVYGELENASRTKAGRELDTLFSPDFETKRLPFTVDDPYLAAVEAEQRSSADETIRRMLDRGVITQSGYNAAMEDLNKQGAGVKSRLNEIGTGLIGTGQQSLKDVANRGRQGAANLKVDQAFNAQDFGSEADRIAGEFLANLGTGIRSRISGDLFSTSGLGNVAGAAMGGRNTPFDPNVMAGGTTDTVDPDKEEEQTAATPLF
jgi:hypothetical protein